MKPLKNAWNSITDKIKGCYCSSRRNELESEIAFHEKKLKRVIANYNSDPKGYKEDQIAGIAIGALSILAGAYAISNAPEATGQFIQLYKEIKTGISPSLEQIRDYIANNKETLVPCIGAGIYMMINGIKMIGERVFDSMKAQKQTLETLNQRLAEIPADSKRSTEILF